MLLNDFFTINEKESSATEIWAEILINADHKIFEGHFPGQPVVPGVCMMQMIKEILEQVTGKKTNLAKAHEMKFLAIIDPVQNNNISATLKYSIAEEGAVIVTAALFKETLIHFRFKGQFDFQRQA